MEILERLYHSLKVQISSLPARIPKSVDQVSKTICMRLPPFTKENMLYYYAPMQGLVSYTTLSISVMNPHLMVRVFPRRDVTDVLFLSAGTGAGLWLWARPHMAAAAPARRLSWALLGGCLWPLGSIFLWAILRSTVGQRPMLGTILGVTSGIVLTNTAFDYFRYVDMMFCGDVTLPEESYSPNSDDEKIYDIDI